MDEVRARIERTSTAIAVVLLCIAAICICAVLWGAWNWIGGKQTLDIHAQVNAGVWLLRYTLISALLVYAALIFFRIGSEETPFFKELPRRIKIAAVLLFVALTVPQWIGYAVISGATGTVSFVIFDENSIVALALAFVVFCLGQIFEYGYLVQDENYEII
ncbi:hypothetical protein [Raoultibacter timonensis]|uniref:hypothetical protein n=1 Tax=Raoultibacter timonensis TaxID=1907662 RepID=UPI000C848316|nr:hypothetical protein [Raoultibacter timonensis]